MIPKLEELPDRPPERQLSAVPSKDFCVDTGPRWIVAQEGSRQSYGVPISFHRLGQLKLFYADIWCRFGRSLLQHGTAGMRAMAGRFVSEIPADKVVSFNLPATALKSVQNFTRGRQSPTSLGDSFCQFGRMFGQQVRNHLSTIELDPKRDLFFGFDTNSLEALEMLQGRGVFTVLDQVDPGLVHEDMVLEEIERWPGWQKSPGRFSQSYWDRRKLEWAIADVVLVNSIWSLRAIASQGVPAEKIVIVPLAIDIKAEQLSPPIKAEGPLKVLWLGNVVVAKGIQYLVEAARILEKLDIQFLLAGPIGIEQEVVRQFPRNIQILGRITRDRLARVYRQAHVFVLPTISDGFAVTQLEAMAHGLPVVITPNCGRVVTDGSDGLIIPPRDSRALADALARLDANRQLVHEMSSQALQTVRQYDLPLNARLINLAVMPHFLWKRQQYR